MSTHLGALRGVHINEDPIEEINYTTPFDDMFEIEIDKHKNVIKIGAAPAQEQSKAFIELIRSFKCYLLGI